MGNSVRSTLGNLCGGQQASADIDDNERPVAKPKEGKKKDKKNKKNKKENNGELPQPPEAPVEENAQSEIDKDKTEIKETKEPQNLQNHTDEPDNNVPVSDEANYSSKSKPQDIPENPSVTLLERASSIEKHVDSPETMTYIIENIPEESPTMKKEKVVTDSPKVLETKDNTEKRTVTFPANLPLHIAKNSKIKNPVTTVVEDEEHNTLDFGKYVFIDPSTGDIQVMRNRSRSLDSLVSMASNRSSISRFGSFELVTDFEINIAEKNQQDFADIE